MSFLDTVSESEADGAVAAIYTELRESLGYVPNYGKEFSLRPDLFTAWVQLNTAIKRSMDPRRYELATLASALQRRSSYCALAHGQKLLGLGAEPGELAALVSTPERADLTEEELEVVRYATKVADDPASITQADIDQLRSVGLSDAEIFDVAAAAAARLFFTALSDATGTLPDPAYRHTMADLIDVLAVGRPLADDPEPSPA